jgi:aminopeptidase N
MGGLEIESVEIDGVPVEYERVEPDLILTPETPIAPKATFEIEIHYRGVPKPAMDPLFGGVGWLQFDGGTYVASEPNGASSWFPCNDHPSDKALFSFKIDVPRETEAIANGQRISVTPDGERTAWVWETTEPMATYLATVVVGEFTIIEATGPDGLPIVHAIADSESAVGAGHVQDTARMIDFFDDYFGSYPLGSYGLIVLPTPLGFALETQTRSLFGSDLYQDAPIRAHELAHQWFGDSLTPQQWDDIWLNEGFATYAEWMWVEAAGGQSVESRASSYSANPGLDTPPGDPGVDELFGQSVYDRGALTLHGIRTKVGDDKFFDILRTWASENRDGNVSTDEFIDLVESKTGTDWVDYFDTWLYQPQFPG